MSVHASCTTSIMVSSCCALTCRTYLRCKFEHTPLPTPEAWRVRDVVDAGLVIFVQNYLTPQTDQTDQTDQTGHRLFPVHDI